MTEKGVISGVRMERDAITRLTFAGEGNTSPVWTPNGQRIVYSSREKGGRLTSGGYAPIGGGNSQRLTESKSAQAPGSCAARWQVLAFTQSNSGTNLDIMTLPIEGDEKSGWRPGEPKPFVNSPSAEVEPAFSPDGRWLAYEAANR